MKRLICMALVMVTASGAAWAADWPQWMGPNRDGVSTETGLLKSWPKDGPKVKWKAKNLGEGYSAPAVAKGKIYLLSSLDGQEVVIALDEKDGKQLWTTKLGKIGVNNGPNYPGPRGTPTVDGDKLFALSSNGDLACLELTKGDIVWKKNLAADFGGKPGNWAYSESPLVDGDVVFCSPGGKTATVVAFKKADGTPAWKTAVPGGDNAAYGSPIKVEVGGVKQYVAFLGNGLVGVNAADGKFLWRYAGPSNKTANIPSPLFHDGVIFGVSGYGKGAGAAKVAGTGEKFTAEQVWFSDQMVSQIGGYVRVGDHLYGMGSGGKGGAELQCVEFATGKIVWKNKSVGAGALCVADGLLYVRGQGGQVALVEPSATAYKELGKFSQTDRSKKPAWPYPVVANGCLYLRDMDVLIAYEVHDGKAK